MTQINFKQVLASFEKLDVTRMLSQWSRLHSGDKEPQPENSELQLAWLNFHNGEFLISAELAQKIEGGISLQLKSLSTYAHYLEDDSDNKIQRFHQVAELADHALKNETTGKRAQKEEPLSKTNIYYQTAYSLGRYGRFISIAKALTEGIAGRISTALEECIALQPDHADAHTAFAAYQAEIIGKLGKLAAKLTYSASTDNSEKHFKKGVELAPFSVSAKTEFADGLLTLYGRKRIKDATQLYEQSVQKPPIDALEALDYFLAKQELADA